MTTVKETKDIKGFMQAFFSKLSRGLMLPIALLPIAGLFLGVGAGIENVIKQFMPDGSSASAIYWATFVPDAFSKIGDVIFGNLPTLFCLGVAVAFSEEAGVAVFSALIGWIVFNATQSTMIWDYGQVLDASGAVIWTGIHNAAPSIPADGSWVSQGYSIFWFVNGIVPTSVVGSNVGITSMQTSVFGGITIGLFVAFLYNRFHTIELPTVIGFFSGSRFVPIITFLTVPLWGIAFLAVWPIFGILLDMFGRALAAMPWGIDAFLFGVVERSLIPFGLHHAFYTPLWYTSAGGTLTATGGDLLGQLPDNVAYGNQGIWFAMQTLGIPYSILNHVGDTDFVKNGFYAVKGADGLTDIMKDGGQVATITAGVDPGAYMQGKFPFMLFGLPAAGAAMIMAAKKENRQVAMSVIGAAALTSFLTGITEPIEFTFLFLAPVLYYGFHVWMAGISFMLLNVLGSHIGMTFSGGIFDYFLFGLLPQWTKFGTSPYWVLLVGAAYAPIYYFVFYFYITKFDVKTPGREDGEVVLMSKAAYKEAKGAGKGDAAWEKRADELLVKLGGIENLDSINACITRLRLDVADPSKVDYAGVKAMGSKGCVGEGKKAQQHIFGAEADKFKNYFLKIKKG